jgi:hypothetical protein
MTKTQTLKFLKKKKSQLQNTNPPHEVIKWIRVSKQYILHLFGDDSQIYKVIESIQILNPSQQGYNESIQVMQARMSWLLEDCIELVESGSVDNKFDKNFIYAMSDGAIATLITFILVSTFSIGFWYGSKYTTNETKISFPKWPLTVIVSDSQNNGNHNAHINNSKPNDSVKH